MGGQLSSSSTVKETINATVLSNIYDLATTCQSNVSQTQSMVIQSTGAVNIGTLLQKQSSKSDLTCLSNKQLTTLFDQNNKDKLKTKIQNSISGVGTLGMNTNLLSDTITNKIYTENNISIMQTAINNITQAQTQLISGSSVTIGSNTQEQISDALLSQIDNVTSEAMVQAKQESEIENAQSNIVVGTDVTKIVTTGIITAGNVITSMTNFLLYGAIFLFILFIVGVFVVISIIKRNCNGIKQGMDNISKKIPIPMIHLKLMSAALGIICPDTNKDQTQKMS